MWNEILDTFGMSMVMLELEMYLKKSAQTFYMHNFQGKRIGSLEGDTSHLRLLMIDSPRKNLGSQANSDEADEFRDDAIYSAIIRYFIEVGNQYASDIQLFVINNGYPDFLPKESIVAEFDGEGTHGIPVGLIDDVFV